MRINTTLIVLLMINWPLVLPGQNKSLVEAHQFLQKKDYASAINAYESLDSMGHWGLALYYNLGIAYYETGDYPRAVLNFEKAKKIKPNNKDVNHNLSLANSKIEQDFILVETFFLKKWWEKTIKSMSLTSWMIISGLILLLSIVSCYFMLFGNSQMKKRLGVKVFFPVFALFFFTIIASNSRYNYLTSTQHAIILEKVDLFEGADTRSEKLYLLKKGTKIKITDSLEGWIKIELINKETGWMEDGGYGRI